MTINVNSADFIRARAAVAGICKIGSETAGWRLRTITPPELAEILRAVAVLESYGEDPRSTGGAIARADVEGCNFILHGCGA